MAEGIARQTLRNLGHGNIEVASAGVYAFRGAPAVANAIEAVSRIGIDIQSHQSQDLYPSLIRESDALLVMSPSHARNIMTLDARAKDRIVELWRFTNTSGALEEIEDPVGQDLAAFVKCRDLLQQCIDNWLAAFLTDSA